MRIAVSGTEFSDSEPLGSLVDAATRVGVRALELWYPRNFGDLSPVEVRHVLDEAGIEAICVSTPSELGDPRQAQDSADLLLAAIEVAAQIGATRANTYFGAPEQRDDRASIARYLHAVTPCLRRAEQLGVVIVLENEFDLFGTDTQQADLTRRPEAMRALLEAVGSPCFRANFDAANFVCAGVQAYPHAYTVLREYVAYAHVKDVLPVNDEAGSVGTRMFVDHGRAHITRPLGHGVIPWPDLLVEFASNPALDSLTLEPHLPREQRDEGLAQAVTYVREALSLQSRHNEEGLPST